jgi:hypothetical protein
MASPSETTLIVLATAAQARLIDPGTASFWQVVTAIGLTLTPLLAIVGRRASRRIDHAAHDAPVAAEEGAVVIIGFGRVGRMVATLLDAHGRAWSAVETDPDAAAAARAEGFAVSFGDAARMETLDRMNLNAAGALVLTMDDPVLGARFDATGAGGISGPYDHRPGARCEARGGTLPRGCQRCGAGDAGKLAATVRGRAGRPRRRHGSGDRLHPRKARGTCAGRSWNWPRWTGEPVLKRRRLSDRFGVDGSPAA